MTIPDKLIEVAATAAHEAWVLAPQEVRGHEMWQYISRHALGAAFAALPDCEEAQAPVDVGYGLVVRGWKECLTALAQMAQP